MARLSARPLLISWVRAWVEVGCSGGKIRLGSGYFLFDIGPQSGLIVFDGEQVVAPRFEDDHAGRFILRVQGIQTDKPARQVQDRQKCSVPRFFREVFPFGFVVKREAMARC
jgi:hypothetical protein